MVSPNVFFIYTCASCILFIHVLVYECDFDISAMERFFFLNKKKREDTLDKINITNAKMKYY